MWELWVKFSLGQNKDYQLGDSISDSTEKLLWSQGKVKSITYIWFLSERIRVLRHTFWQSLLLVVADVTINDSNALLNMEDARIELIKFSHEISNYLRPLLTTPVQSALFLNSTPGNSFQGVLKSQQLQWFVT